MSFTATYRTLCTPTGVTGTGIHTGASSRVVLHPAPPKTGIVFRVDAHQIPALATQVVDTSRCTVLGNGIASISTVEHLLSACAGVGISDLIVEVYGPELPIGDGSALLWVEAIGETWLEESTATMEAPRLTEPVIVTGKGGAFIAAYPRDRATLTAAISFDHALVGTQVAHFDLCQDDYAQQIAPARTFGFIEEVEALQKAGLALGGSLENAVVVYPDHYSVPLHFFNELARHKLLDMMGDLMLTGFGRLPNADIIAVKPSHRLNVAFAAQLAERFPVTATGR